MAFGTIFLRSIDIHEAGARKANYSQVSRLKFDSTVTNWFIRPHLGSSRKIHSGQKIHSSLILSDKKRGEYTPKARPPDEDPNFWARGLAMGLGDWLEPDLYEHTHALLERLITESPGTVLQTLHQTAMSGTSA